MEGDTLPGELLQKLSSEAARWCRAALKHGEESLALAGQLSGAPD